MATTIQPSIGHGALFTQAGDGASPGYSAIDLRRALSVAHQEGAIDSGSYKVTQRAAGANMSCDIAASTGAGALIEGDSVAEQGLYTAPPHMAVINEAITAADATNPRLDQVLLETKDDTHDASALNQIRTRVVAGTPTAGATLDNRSGAAALPSSAIRLADVLVAASDTSIVTADIRDRRPWARGFNFTETRTSGAVTISTSWGEIDSTNLKCRAELSGAPLLIQFHLSRANPVSAGNRDLLFRPWIDGAAMSPDQYTRHEGDAAASSSRPYASGSYDWPLDGVVSAGSHLISIAALAAGSDWTIPADNDYPLRMTVREVLQQSASND